MRGYLTRKRIRIIKNQGGFGKSMMNKFDFNGPANFDNPEVQVSKDKIILQYINPKFNIYKNYYQQRIREQLGQFDYGKEETGLGQREMRQLVTLEYGARY